VRFTKYLKSAFLYHWNLLAFGAGMAVAFISGHADVVAPLVLAGEVLYLTALSANPKFQKHVDAREAAGNRQQLASSAETSLQQILSALPARSIQRFEALRARCLELRQIAAGLRDPGQTEGQRPLEELHLAGLDRLLWTFLRLLYTHHMLERFLQMANPEQIRRTITNLEQSLNSQTKNPDNPQRQKIIKTIEDDLETCRARLANLQKGRDHIQLVQLEIDRLENKICSLSEMALTHQEPNYIAGQVDETINGMVQTERTMNELRFATGLTQDEAVPQLVQRQTVATTR
jgi:hypothetical protein